MSQRYLVEINTDYLHALEWDQEWWPNLLQRLASTHYAVELYAANHEGRPIDIGHGARLVLQRHHSDDVTVSTKWSEVKL